MLKKKLKRLMVAKELDLGKIFKKLGSSLMILANEKLIRLHLLKIIVRCVFREGGKLYPQLFLDDALYELV